MNNFGLGIILDFTDNASGGMSGAAKTFQNLSATVDQVSSSFETSAINMYAIAQSMIGIGDTMQNIGQSILGVFGSLTQGVIDTGNQMLSFRMSLRAMYGEIEGDRVIEQLKTYAMESVFELEDLMSLTQLLKVSGIDALQEVTTSSGQTTQKILDYASDLAAMLPNMRNSFGTGVVAAAAAFKEYVAEGNEITLRRSASMDITGTLGEEKGATAEDRLRQVADLIEHLGIAGYTKNLFGTPMQELSNMNDALFNMQSSMADSGAFDAYAKLLHTAAVFLQELVGDEERCAVITTLLGEVITSLFTPLQAILDFIVRNADAVINWAAENPFLAKTIMLLVAALGALLVLGGTLLKFSGNILMLVVALQHMGGVSKVFGLVRSGLSRLLTAALPIVAIAAGIYYAWSTNLFGLRDLATNVFGDLITVIRLAFDAWSDGELSAEGFQQARDMGILPFIESLMDLRYHWGFFTSGFSAGLQSFSDKLTSFFGKFEPVTDIVSRAARAVGEFLKQFFDLGDGNDSITFWTNLGIAAGEIAGALLVIIPLILAVKTGIGLVSGVISLITNPITWIVLGIAALVAGVIALKYAWDTNWHGMRDTVLGIFQAIQNFYITYLQPVVDFIANIVNGIINVLNGLITFLVGVFTGNWSMAWDGVCQVFGVVWDAIKAVASAAVNFIIGIINNMISTIYNAIAGVVNMIASIANSITGFFGIETNFGMHGSAPQIPTVQFAEGGLVSGPTSAIIGEGGDDEAVLPLNDSVFSRLAAGINGNAPVQQTQASNNVTTNNTSVSFGAGAIVVKANSTSDADLEKAASKLMKIMQRKIELKKMAERNTKQTAKKNKVFA